MFGILPDEIHILGATGFLGRLIRKRLERRWGSNRVFGYGRGDCDLLDQRQTRRCLKAVKRDSSFVFCPAISFVEQDTWESFQRNVDMLRNFLQAVEGKIRCVVFLSSTEVYGLPPCHPVIDEDTPPRPINFYGLSKWVSELLLSTREIEAPVCILRLPGVYGAGDAGRSVIGRMARRLFAGQTVSLTSGGSVKRDYVWAGDVAEIAAAAIEEPRVGVYNVATGKSLPLIEIVQRIALELESTPNVERAPADPRRDHDLAFDVRCLSRFFPEIRSTSLDEGIARYVREIRAESNGAGESRP